jgi:phosphoglycolate phosphatase
MMDGISGATPTGGLVFGVDGTSLLPRPRMVLIDLDGTLVDTVPDLAYATDVMMQRLGLPERGEPAVRAWIGNGVERLVKRALLGAVDGEPDAELYARAYPIFLEVYQANVCTYSRLFPGVAEGIAYLKKLGVPLGCVTNKPAQFTEPLLRQLGLYDSFGIVVSGDTLTEKKPHPAPLLHAAAHFDVPPSECLLIGDSINDVQAARAAGFAVLCVTYGYNHGQDIREARPDAVVDSLAALAQILA